MNESTRTICPTCGAEFVPHNPKGKYCSAKCARAAEKRRWWLRCHCRDLHEFDKAMSTSRPVSLEEIRRAKTKPANTSDVRWRIELRRRAKAEYFDVCGECR